MVEEKNISASPSESFAPQKLNPGLSGAHSTAPPISHFHQKSGHRRSSGEQKYFLVEAKNDAGLAVFLRDVKVLISNGNGKSGSFPRETRTNRHSRFCVASVPVEHSQAGINLNSEKTLITRKNQ